MSDLHGALHFQREVDRVLMGLKFKSVKPTAPYFRPDTELPIIIQNYYLKGGGMGDNLCHLPSLVWIAKNCPWIHGRVWIASMLVDVFSNIISQTGNENWEVKPIEKFDELCENGTRIRGRAYVPEGGKINYQFANGTGGHLVDVGFIDNTNTFPPPEGGDVFPVINFAGGTCCDYQIYPKKYVVFTTGAVSPARTVPGHYWNPLISYVKAKGLEPVFLGTSKMVEINVKFPDGCNYQDGFDLRNKTTVMEAAWIMNNSAAVVGLDNGLIQLASFTEAPIVCAYNMVHPSQRVPKRTVGKWKTIFLSRDELACTGCQTFMKLIAPPHDFKRCLYGDLRCIHLLFENDALKFRSALDEVLA